MEKLKNELMDHGLKATNQRLHVLAYLKETTAHPSAAMVAEYLKEKNIYASTATVYNILMTFLDKGMIRKVCEVEGVAHFDYNTADHIHILHSGEGTITDLEENDLLRVLNEKLKEKQIEAKKMDVLVVT